MSEVSSASTVSGLIRGATQATYRSARLDSSHRAEPSWRESRFSTACRLMSEGSLRPTSVRSTEPEAHNPNSISKANFLAGAGCPAATHSTSERNSAMICSLNGTRRPPVEVLGSAKPDFTGGLFYRSKHGSGKWVTFSNIFIDPYLILL